MIDRAIACAEARRGADGGLDEIVGAGDGVTERHALPQPAGNGGRQRAAGAVGVGGIDALGDVGARRAPRSQREQKVGERCRTPP